jgi:hypothetical protein
MYCVRSNGPELTALRDEAVPKQITNETGVARDVILELEAGYAMCGGFAAHLHARISGCRPY